MARAEKLSVSIDKQELAWVRRHAKRVGKSVSAVLTDAVREKRRAEAMERLLRRLRAQEISEEQMAAVRRELFGA